MGDRLSEQFIGALRYYSLFNVENFELKCCPFVFLSAYCILVRYWSRFLVDYFPSFVYIRWDIHAD